MDELPDFSRSTLKSWSTQVRSYPLLGELDHIESLPNSAYGSVHLDNLTIIFIHYIANEF